MRALLRHFMDQECAKLIRRHYEYLTELQDEIARKSRRLGSPLAKEIKLPAYWNVDPRFNPFKVRGSKLELYAHTLSAKVSKLQYTPACAVIHKVPKPDGTARVLNVFQVPDAALSRLIYKSLLHKNANKLSAYAYAYREDRGAHDAIHSISSEWKNLDRVYVAEFDFSKYFDNINHDYLLSTLDSKGFIYSDRELAVIKAFLSSKSIHQDEYGKGVEISRTSGIPQGTSISLFLANLACWELDRSLERLGVGFSRYADDTLIWSSSYEKVVDAYEVIRKHSELIGVPLNIDKSAGISLLTKAPSAEIFTKPEVHYFGYSIGMDKVAIEAKHQKKIKKKMSYLIYSNLLQPLNQGVFNLSRVKGMDWDYVVCISQLRRYLYGGLTDTKLREYLNGTVPHLNFRGLMSYYPLVNDPNQLRYLDGWLIHTVKQSMKLRNKMWQHNHGISLPGPTSDWFRNVDQIKTMVDSKGTEYDLRIPSFTLIVKAMQLAMQRGGVKAVIHPTSTYY